MHPEFFILTLDDCKPRFQLPPTPTPHNLDWIIAQLINENNRKPNKPEQNNTNGAVYSKIVLFLCKEKRKKTQFTHIIKAAPWSLPVLCFSDFVVLVPLFLSLYLQELQSEDPCVALGKL